MTSQMARIVRFHSTGGPEVLQVDECIQKEPGPDDITVRIKAFALNRAECMLRRGDYIFQPITPCRIGFEGTGIIESLGATVRSHKIGDTVSIIPFAIADSNGYWQGMPEGHGCYGETTTAPQPRSSRCQKPSQQLSTLLRGINTLRPGVDSSITQTLHQKTSF